MFARTLFTSQRFFATRGFASFTEKASSTTPKVPKTPQDLLEQYQARFNKTQTSYTTVTSRIEALTAKKPSKKEEINLSRAQLLDKYTTRQTTLEQQLKRAKKLLSAQQRKIERAERLQNLPPADQLRAMQPQDRLNTLAKVDTSLKTGYQLYAKELSILKPGTPFAEFIEGWKTLAADKKQVYLDIAKAQKAAREAAQKAAV
eukprot:UN00977